MPELNNLTRVAMLIESLAEESREERESSNVLGDQVEEV
jgi:hypothetical protein